MAFYLFGQILGLLLISQFWTLANEVYDARQAKRLFGFIGAGASLGALAGATIVATIVHAVGTDSLLLISAATLIGCMTLVVAIAAMPSAAPDRCRKKPASADGKSVSSSLHRICVSWRSSSPARPARRRSWNSS